MGTPQLRPFLHQRLALGKAMSGRITKQMHCTQPGCREKRGERGGRETRTEINGSK